MTWPIDEVTSAFASLLAQAGEPEDPIRSRWQHDAVPPWRRLPAVVVCEVAFTTIDRGRWLRTPARFLRWRPDKRPQDCRYDQLEVTPAYELERVFGARDRGRSARQGS